MSRISFSPVLEEIVRVQVSSYAIKTTLCFSASASEQLANGTLQLWTDAPSVAGTPQQWNHFDFTLFSPSQRSPNTISLLSTDNSSSDDVYYLELHVPLPISGQFSFTYRLRHSSGEIQWLGQFGKNGTLVFETVDDDLSLNARSTRSSDSGFEWKEQQDSFQIAKLRDCSKMWAFGRDIMTVDKHENASLICVLPEVHDSISIPQLFVFAASSSSSVTINEEGIVTAHGGAYFQMTNPAFDFAPILDRAALNLSVVHNDSSFVLVYPTSTCVYAAVIPFGVQPKLARTISVELTSLPLPQTAGEISISLRGSNTFSLVSAALGDEESTSILLDSSGGWLIISPVYRLNDEWRLSITTPHTVLSRSSPTNSVGFLSRSRHLFIIIAMFLKTIALEYIFGRGIFNSIQSSNPIQRHLSASSSPAEPLHASSNKSFFSVSVDTVGEVTFFLQGCHGSSIDDVLFEYNKKSIKPVMKSSENNFILHFSVQEPGQFIVCTSHS